MGNTYYNGNKSPLVNVSTHAIVKELKRRSRNTSAVTCVKKEDVYIITVEGKEVDI